MKNWLLFIIIPAIFNFSFIKASNFASTYNHTAAIFILFGFLWLVGFLAYYLSPYRSVFLTLTLLGALTATNFLKVILSDVFQENLLPPVILFPAVLLLPYIGLWKAWKTNTHVSDN